LYHIIGYPFLRTDKASTVQNLDDFDLLFPVVAQLHKLLLDGVAVGPFARGVALLTGAVIVQSYFVAEPHLPGISGGVFGLSAYS
jgi:hypothetical protein